jgi:hypothetical protein
MTMDRILQELQELAAQIVPAEKIVKAGVPKRDRRIIKAVAAGWGAAEVAKAAGVSRQYVTKVAPAKATRRRAADERHAVATVAVAEVRPEAEIPTLDPHAPLVATRVAPDSGEHVPVVSRRQVRRYGARVTAWTDHRAGVYVTSDGRRGSYPPGDHRSAAPILAGLPADVTRVYLVGPRPGGEFSAEHASEAAAVRAWFYVPVPGWDVSGSGHYLRDTDTPTGRWHPTDNPKRKVEMYRAATWMADTVTDVATAAAVMAQVGNLISQRFDGAGWLSTPATTGRDLWARTIPEGTEYPVLSKPVRQLLAATAGQGRSEVLESAEETLPNFVYLDGRVMYAALTWGMPIGVPARWTAAQFAALDTKALADALKARGRWRVRVTVPEDWTHVGLLMAPATDGTWVYPARPGQQFTTWADGAEVDLAMRNGWTVEVTEGLTWAEGKPLDTWTKHLLWCWTQADDAERRFRDAGDHASAVVAKHVRGAFRSIILFAIGAFATRTHITSGSVPADRPDLVPEGAVVRREGPLLIWERHDEGGAWTEGMSHPEWSAAVWARARVRLLDGPGVSGGPRTGALHLDRSEVVAFRTDALYLTRDPGWPDDGKPGRFRSKGAIGEPVPAPHTLAELYLLRDRAEDGSQ